MPGAACFALVLGLALGAAPGAQVKHTITITDPDARLAKIDREYLVSTPYATGGGGGGPRSNNKTYPLLVYLHGQYGHASGGAAFGQLGASEEFITVAPQGIGDGSFLGLDTTWSVRAEGRTDVCERLAAQTVMSSCRAVGRVSKCNWATCYDDMHFFAALLARVVSAYPVDASRVFLAGCSNGAMLAEYLQTQLPPGTVAAVVPWYGAFLAHYVDTREQQRALRGATLLALHGAKDELIPPAGGVDKKDKYAYVSENVTVARWAAANGCSPEPTALRTPYQARSAGKAMEHTCVEHGGCEVPGVRVAYCSFPRQAHGFWPSFGEELTWWFLTGSVPATAVA